MAAQLVFLNGAKAGVAFQLGDTPVTIGRGPTRTIVIPSDEVLVSTEHATIQRQDGRYLIRDDGSRNGTWVNEEVVRERVLEHGDLIQFGLGGPSARFVVETAPGLVPTLDVVARPGHRGAARLRTTSAMPAIVTVSPDTAEAPTPETENRRSFLKLMSVLAGAGTAALAGIPALFSFASPLFRPRREGIWVKLGDAFSFPTGVPNKKDFSQTVKDAWVEVQTMQSVWVYTEDGEHFTVYDARCTHLGCGYNYSKSTNTFDCPCHGGRFDPKTGAVLAGPPPRPLDRLPGKVEDGVLYVQLA